MSIPCKVLYSTSTTKSCMVFMFVDPLLSFWETMSLFLISKIIGAVFSINFQIMHGFQVWLTSSFKFSFSATNLFGAHIIHKAESHSKLSSSLSKLLMQPPGTEHRVVAASQEHQWYCPPSHPASTPGEVTRQSSIWDRTVELLASSPSNTWPQVLLQSTSISSTWGQFQNPPRVPYLLW